MLQQRYPQSDQNGIQSGPQKSPNPGCKKKLRIHVMVWTPECASSVVNTSKIDEIQVLFFASFWVSFWRCFGSPLGGQGHQKATSKKRPKKYAQNEATLVPKGTQNGPKTAKNEVLEASHFQGWFPSGFQTPQGSILERFWHHFGLMLCIFSNACWVVSACAC